VNARGPNNDGPRRFARNWLMFDESRPTRPRLLRNFILVVAACFAVTALLAIINAMTR
jgi:hypothetical protein